jgi:hypothetical protein
MSQGAVRRNASLACNAWMMAHLVVRWHPLGSSRPNFGMRPVRTNAAMSFSVQPISAKNGEWSMKP